MNILVNQMFKYSAAEPVGHRAAEAPREISHEDAPHLGRVP
jgi:hypothetical protein